MLLLGQILSLSAVKLQTARNQMDYKMQLRQDTHLKNFCSLNNLTEVVTLIFVPRQSPAAAVLVKGMLSLIQPEEIIGQEAKVERLMAEFTTVIK